MMAAGGIVSESTLLMLMYVYAEHMRREASRHRATETASYT